MSKQFTTYKELIEEKQRLEVLASTQKELIRYHVQQLKIQLQPVADAAKFIGKITSKDKSSLLLNIGSDVLINSVVKNFILSRAGWLSRLLIPYFLKNYSSHFLADQKQKWFHKLSHWLHGNRNGKHKKQEAEEKKNEEDVF